MTTFPDLQARLEAGKVIILDGATGTELQRRGVPMHGFAWSAAALDTHPETVRVVHEDYIRAGADVIITNSFSTARHVLEPAGLGDRVRALNQRAVTLAQAARENAASGRPVAIAGSISSFRADRTPAEQLEANYREQAELLAEAGVEESLPAGLIARRGKARSRTGARPHETTGARRNASRQNRSTSSNPTIASYYAAVTKMETTQAQGAGTGQRSFVCARKTSPGLSAGGAQNAQVA